MSPFLQLSPLDSETQTSQLLPTQNYPAIFTIFFTTAELSVLYNRFLQGDFIFFTPYHKLEFPGLKVNLFL